MCFLHSVHCCFVTDFPDGRETHNFISLGMRPWRSWIARVTPTHKAAGSNPVGRTSSEIPNTVPFPPCGENCTLLGIPSLSAAIRFAGFAVERDGGCGPLSGKQSRWFYNQIT